VCIGENKNLILSHMPGLLSVLSCGWRKLNRSLIGTHDIVDLGEFDRHGRIYSGVQAEGYKLSRKARIKHSKISRFLRPWVQAEMNPSTAG
jgi:hypothetical protein